MEKCAQKVFDRADIVRDVRLPRYSSTCRDGCFNSFLERGFGIISAQRISDDPTGSSETKQSKSSIKGNIAYVRNLAAEDKI